MYGMKHEDTTPFSPCSTYALSIPATPSITNTPIKFIDTCIDPHMHTSQFRPRRMLPVQAGTVPVHRAFVLRHHFPTPRRPRRASGSVRRPSPHQFRRQPLPLRMGRPWRWHRTTTAGLAPSFPKKLGKAGCSSCEPTHIVESALSCNSSCALRCRWG